MKIIHVAPPFLPLDSNMDYGGTERVIISLINKELRSGLNQVQVIAPQDSTLSGLLPTISSIGVDEIYQEATPKIKVRFNSWAKMANVGKVLEYAAQNRTSVFHVHDDLLVPFFPQIGNQVLMTLHSPYEEFWMTEEFPGIEKIARNLVAISNKQKQIYQSHNYSIREVIYNGIDIENHPYSYLKDDFLLSLGAIVPHKGQYQAIQIAKSTDNSLILAGNIGNQIYFDREIKPHIEYDLSDQLDKLAAYRQLPLRPKIVYVGSVNDVQKLPLYAQAKAFLMPVSWEEPFGLVAIEALAGGTPVIATARGALPELIDSGRTGFLCNTPAEMSEALRSIKNINPQDCRRYVEDNFSLDMTVRKYLEPYHQVQREASAFA